VHASTERDLAGGEQKIEQGSVIQLPLCQWHSLKNAVNTSL